MPPAQSGMTIGLFGGSFDPPHEGHRHASLTVLRRLGIDRVWWLVTPGNPLKDVGRLPPIEARVRAAARLAAHPRVIVTDLEARLGTRYTADLIEAITRLRPDLRFVLVIGADNWATFHRWGGWRSIAGRVPIAVVDRPGATFRALGSVAARSLSRWRLPETRARELKGLSAPAWVFLTGHRVPISSTMIRARRSVNGTETGTGAAS